MKNYSAKLSKCVLGLFTLLSSLTTNATGSVEQSNAQPYHDLSNIVQAAENFLIQNIDTSQYSRTETHMGQLDNRLRLAHCSSPLITSLAPGSKFEGKTTVHVKCNEDAQWTVYVNANIHLYSLVMHTSEPLEKGHILSKSDLIASEVNLSNIRYGYFTDADSLIGKQLKMRLPQNKMIRVNYVKSPTLIKRGEIVTIVAENSGYSVKMSGTAMSNGVKGERVQVKNISSQRIIEGTVVEPGVININ